jgi:hypothetical protein
MRCVHCQFFQGLKKISNSSNGSEWKCGPLIIQADTQACDQFVLNSVIVCPKKNKFRRMHIDACMHWQIEKHCKCKVGLEIKAHIRSQPTKLVRRK